MYLEQQFQGSAASISAPYVVRALSAQSKMPDAGAGTGMMKVSTRVRVERTVTDCGT
jgi:hypothetical protein